MRWITFFILLYLLTAMQVSHFLALSHAGHPWPVIQYVPLLAIFYALFATEASAPLAALVCGAAYDLGNYPNDILGTNLVPLALVAFFVLKMRLSIFREHVVSQFLITLLAMLVFSFLSVVMRVLVQAPLEGGSAWVHLGLLVGNALYTALAAPFLFWFLFRLTPLLGFTSHGPRSRGKA